MNNRHGLLQLFKCNLPGMDLGGEHERVWIWRG